jgi:cytochrome P450
MRIDRQTHHVDLDPRDPAFVQNPYAAYHAIRAETPVFWWQQYGFWCFCSHAAVSDLLRDRRFGRQILHVASRVELGLPEVPPHLAPFHQVEQFSLLELEPPAHTRLRGLVNRAFVSRQVERLRPRIAALAHQLIDGFIAQGSVDLLPAYATPIPVTIIADLVGLPRSLTDQLLDWSHAMVAMYQFSRSRAVEDAAVAAAEAFAECLREAMAVKRRDPGDDLMSLLLAAQNNGSGRELALSDDELVSTVVLLLNAGHEATVHTIGNGTKALLEAGINPTLITAPNNIARLVEEVLRFDAPLHMFTRYALQDLSIAGIDLKRGDTIGLLLGAANRDPAQFMDPDRFDPSRTTNPHVSFGAGIHFCLGAPLARLELEVALPILFERLPALKCVAPPQYGDTYHFHGLKRLDVSW